jgi:hypothetical protein
MDKRSKNQHIGQLIKIARTTSVQEVPFPDLLLSLRPHLSDKDTSVIGATFRCIRYITTESSHVELILQSHIHFYISRTLERDPRNVFERMQALKLAQRVLELDSSRMPRNVVRSLVAIAGHKDDSFRRVCLECLREMTVSNIEVVAECNGVRTLFDAALDPTVQDLSESIVLTMMYLLNEPEKRQYVRPSLDLQAMFAVFYDTDIPPGNERTQKWASSRTVIITMIRTWTGMLLLASDPFALPSLVDLLVKSVDHDIQRAVLDIIREVFYLSDQGDSTTDSSAKELQFITPTRLSSSAQKLASPRRTGGTRNSSFLQDPNEPERDRPHNLLDNYMSMLLTAFAHCGLISGLAHLGMTCETDADLATAATSLLCGVLHLAFRLLPEDQCGVLVSVPALVNVAAIGSKKKLLTRVHARSATAMLGQVARAVGAGSIGPSDSIAPSYVNGVHLAATLLQGSNRLSTARGNVGIGELHSSRLHMMTEFKTSLDSLTNQTSVNAQIKRSHVESTKEWQQWDWDVIMELLEGPLTQPVRLAEALKGKFIKRICGFYRCSQDDRGFFAHFPWVPDHVSYLRPACHLYTLLMSHPDGNQFLKTDRRGQLFNEIAAALELESNPGVATADAKRLFSPANCETTMIREYFTLIGLVSSFKDGRACLNESRVIQRLTSLDKQPGKDYLRRLVISNLDYTVDGPARNLLQVWMASGSKAFRLYATCLLRALLRANVEDFADWGIEVLVTQLYTEQEVAELALSVLEESVQQPRYLQALIRKSPPLVQLSRTLPAASNLIIRFLSMPDGYAFLEHHDWIGHALEGWRSQKHIDYVGLVEASLRRGLLRDSSSLASPGSEPQKRHRHAQPSPVAIPVQVPRNDKAGSSNTHAKQGSDRASSFSSAEPAEDTWAMPEYWSLEWLFRMPWLVRVFKGKGGPWESTYERLVVDTFVDASQLRPERYDMDDNGAVRVKAVFVDSNGVPCPIQVESGETCRAALFLGASPVNHDGCTVPEPSTSGGFMNVEPAQGASDSGRVSESASQSANRAAARPSRDQPSFLDASAVEANAAQNAKVMQYVSCSIFRFLTYFHHSGRN